jgi:transcriptional regulator with XRE-family HTH domain
LQVESIALPEQAGPEVTSVSDADLRGFYARLGGNIRSLRVSAGLSQASLAKRIGFTRASVSNLEAGRQRIALHLFVQIAQALDVEPSRLLPSLSSQSESDVLEDLQQHIVHVPESAQDFIFGAVAQLVAGQRREEQ